MYTYIKIHVQLFFQYPTRSDNGEFQILGATNKDWKKL